MIFWPGFAWFVRPSGGPVRPGTRWWRTLYDAPLIAHPAGAWGIVGFMALAGVTGFGAWWAVLLGEAVNQWHKWMDKDYGSDPAEIARNIVWRMLLSAVATLPAWGLG